MPGSYYVFPSHLFLLGKIQIEVCIQNKAIVILKDVLAIQFSAVLQDLIQVATFKSDRFIDSVAQQKCQPVLVKHIGINLFAKA